MMYYLASTTLLQADLKLGPVRSLVAPFLGSIFRCFGARFGVRNWSKIRMFQVLFEVTVLTSFLLVFWLRAGVHVRDFSEWFSLIS